MNIQALSCVASLKHHTHSDLARMAGVSRQAVSLWFKHAKVTGGDINIHTQALKRLAAGLRVSVDLLLSPVLSEEKRHTLTATLLWDRLYPSIESFALALIHLDPVAIGRLTQVYGMYTAEKVIGTKVWTLFPTYRQFINPTRRKECEKIWDLEQSLKKR